MKIVQSFWSKPSFHSFQDYNNSRKFGGWLNFKYFLISTTLSCLSIRKQHRKIELITDDNGNRLLGEIMGLPYDNISLALNTLENENHKLWIMGKMLAIRSQSEPFIHVDNDIYLWEPLPMGKKADYLISQSQVFMWSEYKLSLNEIFANFSYIPECLQERPTAATRVANVGIIGGNDIDFFQEFCEISRQLLDRNRQSLEFVDIGGFNQMMEEYLFTSLARYQKRDIYYLLKSQNQGFPASHLDIHLVPIVYRYIHLIGFHKRDAYACEQLELRLKYEFPDEYRKIIKIINELQDGENNNFITVRQHRLLDAIRILYSRSLADIERMKLRIKPGMEVIATEDFVTSDVSYIVKETEDGGDVVYRTLPALASRHADYWLKYLVSAATLAEIYEGIRHEHTFSNDQEFNSLKCDVINAVMANIILVGTIEFLEA